MRDAWKHLDLEGEGLQSLNLRYSRTMRRPGRAYALMLLFPLGLHRWYLKSPVAAVAYPLLTALTLWQWRVWDEPMVLGMSAALLIFLLFDLFWIRRRCIALNKTLRLRQFMQPGAKPPAGYRGRYVDDTLDDYLKIKGRERAGHQAPDTDDTQTADAGSTQPPSFNEQEAMLQALIRSNKGRRP